MKKSDLWFVIPIICLFIIVIGAYISIGRLAEEKTDNIGVTPPIIKLENVTESQIIIEPTEQPEQKIEEWESLGVYTLTAYCPCKKCNGQWVGYPTASGTDYKSNHTIGGNPNVIPYGTELKIEKSYITYKYKGEIYSKDGTICEPIIYTMEDKCGAAMKKGKKVLDIFFDTHEEAINFGCQKAEVWAKK